MKLTVGIIGGTGYTGKELLKICSVHPNVENLIIYSKSQGGKIICDIFPELDGEVGDLEIKSINEFSCDSDVYFTALPHGESVNFIHEILSCGKAAVDLGGDFRLDDPIDYEKYYGAVHPVPELLTEKKYGLADIHDQYESTKLVANPGCYPTASLLSLLPLVSEFNDKILSISVAAYSGTSGAGKSPNPELLLSEMHGNVKAYNVNRHRHEPEIKQELFKNSSEVPFSFTTHLLPITSGIYSTAVVHLKSALEQSTIDALYQSFYFESPFVRLRKTAPQLKWSLGTNYIDLNIAVGEKRIVITAALDNLIKGAAGQAVQNMNLLFGWDETSGLINRRTAA